VERVAIGIRIDGDRVDPEVSAGTDDADGDLAAIRDQQPLLPRQVESRYSVADVGEPC
jgi:hypothetical protein